MRLDNANMGSCAFPIHIVTTAFLFFFGSLFLGLDDVVFDNCFIDLLTFAVFKDRV